MWWAGTSLALGLPCMSTNWANRNSMPLSLTIRRTSSAFWGGWSWAQVYPRAAGRHNGGGHPLAAASMFDSHIGGACGSVDRGPTGSQPVSESSAGSARRTGPCTASSSWSPRRWSCADAPGRRRPGHRGHRLPRLLHLPARDGRLTIRAASPVFARGRRERPILGRRGADRLGGPAPHAGVHPRPGDGRPAHEVRAAAPGGALPVDGRGPDPGPRGRDDRRDRAPHRGAARVRRGHR